MIALQKKEAPIQMSAGFELVEYERFHSSSEHLQQCIVIG